MKPLISHSKNYIFKKVTKKGNMLDQRILNQVEQNAWSKNPEEVCSHNIVQIMWFVNINSSF